VTDHGNGTYDVTFFRSIRDYTVEVVLAFSRPPPWSDFPVQDEPAYEGYLLPGFPLQVNVSVSVDQHQQKHTVVISTTAKTTTSLLQTQTQTLPTVQQQDKYKDKSHLQHVHAD
jgi:hypothetical protein